MKRLFAWVSVVAALHAAAALAAPTPALAQPKAQSKPVDLIAKGQQLFEDQQYEESIQTLSAALLRPTNTRDQKVEIYRLLALNYITLNRKDEAENAVRGLLTINPDYQLPPSESPRFRDFFAAAQKKWEAEGRPGLVKEKPAQKPILWKHASPSETPPDKAVQLSAKIDDPDGRVAQIKLSYRAGSKGDFTEVTASRDEENVRAEIPASAVQPPILEYFFTAYDDQGGVVSSRGDASTPLRIAVSGGGGWVVPVAIGGGILGAAAIVGGLALAGVFKGSSSGGGGGGGAGKSTVTINIGDSAFGLRFR